MQQQAQGTHFRYISVDDPSQGERGKVMNANIGMRYGLDDVRGYDSIFTKQYVDYISAAYPQLQLDYNRIAPL